MGRSIRVVHVTSDFRKSFQKLPQRIQELATKKDQIFRQDAFTASLRTHKLKGVLGDYWAYSINLQYRILFRFVSDQEVLYLDAGTHEIYR